MENDLTDIAWLLQELENSAADSEHNERYKLTCANLTSIIKSMDTEYDRNALKVIIFATRSRKEVEVLGIKADRAVHFLRKLGNLLPKFRREDLESEKDMLKERAAHVTNLQTKQERSSKKQFQQCKRKLTT